MESSGAVKPPQFLFVPQQEPRLQLEQWTDNILQTQKALKQGGKGFPPTLRTTDVGLLGKAKDRQKSLSPTKALKN